MNKCLVCLAMLVLASVLPAQDKPPLRLTLQEAVRLALKQNPQVQIASLNSAQSEQDRLAARSSLLPQASVSGFEQVQRFNLDALIGHPFVGFPQHVGPFETFQTSATFSVSVFDLTLWRRYQASRQVVEATQFQAQGMREQTTALVVSQYLGSLRAAASVSAARSRVTLAQALYDQASDLQKNGVGTGIDTLRANVELQNEKQQLLVAETQLKTSLYGLARLLSLDPRQPAELADEPSFFETPPITGDQSLETAMAARPEMKALEARERAVRLQREEAGAERLPTVRAGGFWGYQGLSALTVIPAYQYQLGVSVPLFTGGRIAAETAKADLELKKVAQQRLDIANQIALEVKTALAELDSARNQVDVASLAVRLARDEVDQARDRFQAGVANNIEVISAQDALARANDNQIVALYRYNQARADLARATGRMENLYAK